MRASPTFPNTAGPTTDASVAMIAITTSSSMSVKPRLVLDDTQHLLHCCEAGAGFLPAVGAQRDEPGLLRDGAHARAGSALHDRLAQLVGEQQHLEHADPSAKAGAAAVRATGAPHHAAREDRLAGERRHALRGRLILHT